MKAIIALLPLVAAVLAQYDQVPIGPISSPSKPLTLDAIPLLGFGTWNLKEKNTSEAVSWAIQVGYRHIDCAAIYGNEQEVGKGISDGLLRAGLSREDVWITSKLWNDHHDPNKVEAALDASLQKLGLTYLDLYHMHWPVTQSLFGNNKISYLETWGAMTLLQQRGKTRYIGVSNFSPDQLQDLLNHTSVPPAVHQMELHPYLQQNGWLEWHRRHDIHVTAYSPLGGTNPTYDDSDTLAPLLKHKTVKKVAKRRGCTPAQVALQWGMGRGTSVIPKSIHKDRIVENFESFECGLKTNDQRLLATMEKYHHRYNNPSEGWGVSLYDGLEDDDGKHGKAKYRFDL